MQGEVVRILHVGPSNRRRVSDVIRRRTHAGEAEADQMVRRTPTELEHDDDLEGFARELEAAGAVIEMSAPGGALPRRALFLEACGPNKIMVIKAIREHVGLGLKEAKDMAESAPREIVEWDDAGRIERFRKALIEAGATVK